MAGKLLIPPGTHNCHSNLKAAMRVCERSPDAYGMERGFETSSLTTRVGGDLGLEIVDIVEELGAQLEG